MLGLGLGLWGHIVGPGLSLDAQSVGLVAWLSINFQ